MSRISIESAHEYLSRLLGPYELGELPICDRLEDDPYYRDTGRKESKTHDYSSIYFCCIVSITIYIPWAKFPYFLSK
jgi:hypothetical protein